MYLQMINFQERVVQDLTKLSKTEKIQVCGVYNVYLQGNLYQTQLHDIVQNFLHRFWSKILQNFWVSWMNSK